MTWFNQLFGFSETTYAGTQQRFRVEGERLLTDGQPPRSFNIGTLSVPSLDELRRQVAALARNKSARATLRAVVDDAYALHARPETDGALIQVASQFNLLEMIRPGVAPEDGITRYAHDYTQGPACAMACAPASVFRNYFAPVEGQRGQTRERQIDALRDFARALGIPGIRMRNGYALLDTRTVKAIGQHIQGLDEAPRDALRGQLRIGVHRDTEVTANGAPSGQRVTQALCSALPVAYNTPGPHWAPFASLVLEASYEAALLSAVLNHRRTGNARVFLTTVGGGAFGNDRMWIFQAMQRAFRCVKDHPLDVAIVCFQSVPGHVANLVAEFCADGR